MRVRVCSLGTSFWVEGKFGLSWKRMPSVNHFLRNRSIAFLPEYFYKYSSYDRAREAAEDYLSRFSKNLAVSVEVKR